MLERTRKGEPTEEIRPAAEGIRPRTPGNRGNEAPETSQRETLWPIRWSWPKRQGRRRRSGTRRPWTSVRAERNGTQERELAGEVMNGRRGAGRSDADRLPTRKKPSQGKAHRVIPRTVRGGPESKGFGAPTTAEGPTWRTPDLVPAATCWRPGTEQTVEVAETTRTERVGRVASFDRSSMNDRTVATRVEPAPSGSERSWRDPEEGPEEGRKVPGEEGRKPVYRWKSSGSGQNAGDDATGEAVNQDRKTLERAPARESTRWPSETTNHEVGRLERPNDQHVDRGRQATARPRTRANVRGGSSERSAPGSGRNL